MIRAKDNTDDYSYSFNLFTYILNSYNIKRCNIITDSSSSDAFLRNLTIHNPCIKIRTKCKDDLLNSRSYLTKIYSYMTEELEEELKAKKIAL